MWFLLTQHFGLRGCQHDMFVEDFAFSKDDNGVEYVTYEENPKKLAKPVFVRNDESFNPKCSPKVGRGPLKLFKTFLSRRPKDIRSSGPFYLAVIERPKTQVWYKRQRMGVNSNNSFMKSMAGEAEIEGKKITNHSSRKTLAEEAQGCKPAAVGHYWRHRSHKREIACRLRGR